MSSSKAEIAIEAPLPSNPLDVIPDEMPFDVPYRRPMDGAMLAQPSPFRAHETGSPFKAGYFRFARDQGTGAKEAADRQRSQATLTARRVEPANGFRKLFLRAAIYFAAALLIGL